MALTGLTSEWTPGTQQEFILDALHRNGAELGHTAKDCAVCHAVYTELLPGLGDGVLVFKNNLGEPLPKGSKRAARFRYKIAEIHEYMLGPGRPAGATAPAVAETAEDDRKPVVTVNNDYAATAAASELIDWIQSTWRPWTLARNADGKPIDEVGLRPAQNGARMLTAGIDVPAIKSALTLHYPPEARRALGVTDYDPTRFTPKQWGAVTVPAAAAKHDGRHKAMPYVKALAAAGVPIALIGPPGTGKTTLAQHLADDIRDGNFGFVSMTQGTSPSAFNGRPRIGSDGTDALVRALIARGEVQEALKVAQAASEEGDVAESEFVRSIKTGGVWLFDEMDAAEPNLMLMTNAVLANRVFYNTATAETIRVHPDWVPMAGMNTMGLGGDSKMVGRNKQDAAALDRWNAGRVIVKLDEALERHIFWKVCANA